MYTARAIIYPTFREGGNGKAYVKKGYFDVGERFLTTSHLARRWGVSSLTIIRLIEQRELGGLKIRGNYRISVKSVLDYETKVAF
ncbi:hypothetical protein MNBD_NITROSPINAE02-1228 [hydrothermal vent metagenome]|uniref:Helix-turn-helix domain-containing protein n=1 Tax=hydrothermal vent metagenome TaxID=652676 RepID=A0A3B1C884_9ZZZZ